MFSHCNPKLIETLYSERGMTARKAVTNWTSTKVPLWETDCIQFWRAGHPFELRDVSAEDHYQFIASFARAHDLEVRHEGSTITFRARSL